MSWSYYIFIVIRKKQYIYRETICISSQYTATVKYVVLYFILAVSLIYFKELTVIFDMLLKTLNLTSFAPLPDVTSKYK